MKKFIYLVIFNFILVNLTATTIQASNLQISPFCQSLHQGTDPHQYDITDVDMCLMTGFVSPSFSKQFFKTYENESTSNGESKKIVSSDIPENTFCSSSKPCPTATITYDDGSSRHLKGHCQLSNNNKTGTCQYSHKVTLEHKLKGIDFSKKEDVDKLQNPNLLLNQSFFTLTTPTQKLDLTLNLLFHKLAPSSKETKYYLGAIDPDTKFTCYYNDGNYTLRQVRDLLPSNLVQAYLDHNFKLLKEIYLQAYKNLQPWAIALACTPLSPQENASTSYGSTYMRLRIFGTNLPPVIDRYPTGNHASLPFSALTDYLLNLPYSQLMALKKFLRQNAPFALPFFPDEPMISKQRFFKTHNFLNNAYTVSTFGNLATNPHSKSQPVANPKPANPSSIEEADSVYSGPGFPANLKKIIQHIFDLASVEKHFIIIPSLEQQLADVILHLQIQTELPPSQQTDLSKETKDHPIAIKGSSDKDSLYPGGLESLHFYQGPRSFSVFMPPSFPEYCSPQESIKDYVEGFCFTSP